MKFSIILFSFFLASIYVFGQQQNAKDKADMETLIYRVDAKLK
jgi:hypothetical protein